MEPSAIVYAGNNVLRQPAQPVPEHMLGSGELIEIVSDMFAEMRAAPGVGLAAPQIGLDMQVIVLEDNEKYLSELDPEDLVRRQRRPFRPLALVNPRLKPVGRTGARFFEGCLSVPGYQAMVERYLEVDVEAVTPMGDPVRFRAHGWQARILQHEVDHLQGILYIDRMLTRSFLLSEGDMEVPPDVPPEGPCKCQHDL